MVVRRDLARRLRPLQAVLKRRLARADVLADMIRAVNASLEPESVAEALVARVSAWIPVPAWLVLADDGGGQTRQMAAEGLVPPFESAAHAIAAWVMRSGDCLRDRGCRRRSAGVGHHVRPRRWDFRCRAAAAPSGRSWRWTACRARRRRASPRRR